MLESVLSLKKVSIKTKITIKMLVSVGLVALAVGLPQIIHVCLGAPGGVQWLPMYLPVLIGGCLLGTWWGLGVGIMSPVVSFLITYAFGNPMPALIRLPYMIVELAVFALVSGAFSKYIAKNKWMAFPAVLLAQVSGRVAFITIAAIFQTVSPLSAAMVWGQIQSGLLGLVLQAVLIPFIIIGLQYLLTKGQKK